MYLMLSHQTYLLILCGLLVCHFQADTTGVVVVTLVPARRIGIAGKHVMAPCGLSVSRPLILFKPSRN